MQHFKYTGLEVILPVSVYIQSCPLLFVLGSKRRRSSAYKVITLLW